MLPFRVGAAEVLRTAWGSENGSRRRQQQNKNNWSVQNTHKYTKCGSFKFSFKLHTRQARRKAKKRPSARQKSPKAAAAGSYLTDGPMSPSKRCLSDMLLACFSEATASVSRRATRSCRSCSTCHVSSLISCVACKLHTHKGHKKTGRTTQQTRAYKEGSRKSVNTRGVRGLPGLPAPANKHGTVW